MRRQACFLLAALFGAAFLPAAAAFAERPGEIRQVKAMPDLPSPFEVRDWKHVAIELDRLIFDPTAKGQWMPLLHFIRNQNHQVICFGIPDYVGDLRQADGSGSGITDLGAVWGATLVGIDKSAGKYDYVKMCDAFFDSRPQYQMVGNKMGQCDPEKTFWYTLFPNIIFASVAERYPRETEMNELARRCATSWVKATNALTKSSNDHIPDFDHTGFDFTTMEGVDNGHWKEPDAGAGVAWIEYAAYLRWHDPEFLHTAESAMRYLNERPANRDPFYEILMPFGALTAVRMNAELGKDYDTSKMINWCFDRSAARPDWQVNADRWDDVDAAGLVGATDCPPWRTEPGGYGFAMNTFCWAWPLVPIARYDPRYAHDLGKWMVNAASAARLFYANYHSADHQSCPGWDGDPNHVIAYEGLKYRWNDPNQPLLASGDPVHEHWGPKTDYGLYGSVFVGVYGAIVSRTNVPQILQLNLLATDTSHPSAYPSYLYYNPLKSEQSVAMDLGPTPQNIYDAVTGRFLRRGATGSTSITINPDQAIVAVITPADGKLTYKNGKTYVNDIVIDYRRGSTSK